jgi:hypothetical protein
MHYLDPETQERVKAAAALAQQKERSLTTPGSHIENSGSGGLGVVSHVGLVYLGLILIFQYFPWNWRWKLEPCERQCSKGSEQCKSLGEWCFISAGAFTTCLSSSNALSELG